MQPVALQQQVSTRADSLTSEADDASHHAARPPTTATRSVRLTTQPPTSIRLRRHRPGPGKLADSKADEEAAGKLLDEEAAMAPPPPPSAAYIALMASLYAVCS